jgi:tetratricopeptide (TPR) repeat protein
VARKAVEVAERAVADNPAATAYRSLLAGSLLGVGELYRNRGRLDEASAALRRSRAIQEDLAKLGVKGELDDIYLALGRVESAMGRPAEASEVLRLAISNLEEAIANNADMPDPVIDITVAHFSQTCDALIEARGPMEPLLHARARFERMDREGRLKPMARQVLVWLDIDIAKAQRLVGRSDEARRTIRRVESELEIFREAGPPSWYPYNLASARALLSTLVGRPGAALSPAERAEMRDYQDRAMDDLQRALDAGFWRMQLLSDPNMDALRARSDFQALLLDLAFPVDPFAP